MSRLADLRRHRFFAVALLAGPLAGSALLIASHLGAWQIPPPNLDWAKLVSVLLLAPVLEELVFRGGVQEALDRTPFGQRYLAGGVSVGNAVASALFSAAHLLVDPPWLAASIFFPSLVFGRLKQVYRSLRPPMFVHAWYNACYLIAGSIQLSQS